MRLVNGLKDCVSSHWGRGWVNIFAGLDLFKVIDVFVEDIGHVRVVVELEFSLLKLKRLSI